MSAAERVLYFYHFIETLPRTILNFTHTASVLMEEKAFSAYSERIIFTPFLDALMEWQKQVDPSTGEKSWLLASKPHPQDGQTSLASL